MLIRHTGNQDLSGVAPGPMPRTVCRHLSLTVAARWTAWRARAAVLRAD